MVDADHQARRVRSSGEIMWKGERVFVTEALIGELVGIAAARLEQTATTAHPPSLRSVDLSPQAGRGADCGTSDCSTDARG